MAADLFKWPEWMGSPLTDGYNVEVLDRRVKTDMEVGSRNRVEFDTDECVVTCSMFFDGEQADLFEVLERDILKQGSMPFEFPLWVGGKLVNHVVRFRTRPTAANKHGDYTEYSFTLDVIKREGLMDKDLAGIILVYGPPEFIHRLANRLHHILHFEAPKVTTVPDNIWTATQHDWESAE